MRYMRRRGATQTVKVNYERSTYACLRVTSPLKCSVSGCILCHDKDLLVRASPPCSIATIAKPLAAVTWKIAHPVLSKSETMHTSRFISRQTVDHEHWTRNQAERKRE